MKNKILILFFIVLITNAKAQDSLHFKKNRASVELLGSCLYYSFNYERVLKRFKNFEFSAEAGYCFLHTDGTFEGCQIPVHLNIVYTKHRIKPEIDLGITNVIDFTPYPKTREERKNWIAKGGPDMSPPYLIHYIPRVGIGYYFNYRLYGKLMFMPILRYYNFKSAPYFNYPNGFRNMVAFPWIGVIFGINF